MVGIFAISDLHLPIDIQIKKFQYPQDYLEQVESHLNRFKPSLLLNVGDFSYESNFKRGLSILSEIKKFGGLKKVFIEGNHDLFCHDDSHVQSLYQFFDNEEFYYLSGRAILLDVSVNATGTEISKKVGLCGAMGWMLNEKMNSQEDLIRFHNQLEILDRSLEKLEMLRDEEFSTETNICLIHHPPTYNVFTDRRQGDESFFNLIREYKFIKVIVYGHIHVEKNFKLYKKVSGIELYCAAVDQLGFKAIRIKV